MTKVIEKFTRCDSGERLNYFLHVFLYLTLVFGVAFAFFGHTEALQASVLYVETVSAGGGFVNLWGWVGILTALVHTAAFWFRGKIGVALMPVAIFGGSYMWVWASVVYILGGFYFQFLVACVPNLAFWAWYAVQWFRRKEGYAVAFVH